MSIINRHAYNKLIDENIEWLLKQPRTLERDHIWCILMTEIRGRLICPKCEYKYCEVVDSKMNSCPACGHKFGPSSKPDLCEEVKRLTLIVQAARHLLLLAAEGPDGGPTNWNDTRARWMELVDNVDEESQP